MLRAPMLQQEFPIKVAIVRVKSVGNRVLGHGKNSYNEGIILQW